MAFKGSKTTIRLPPETKVKISTIEALTGKPMKEITEIAIDIVWEMFKEAVKEEDEDVYTFLKGVDEYVKGLSKIRNKSIELPEIETLKDVASAKKKGVEVAREKLIE